MSSENLAHASGSPEPANPQQTGEHTAAQNSKARGIAARFLDPSADFIVDKAPWFTPNRITLTSAVTATAGTLIIEHAKTKKGRFVGGIVTAIGMGMDGLDGAVHRAQLRKAAKEKAAGIIQQQRLDTPFKGPLKTQREIVRAFLKRGGDVDVASDRYTEAKVAELHIREAAKRGSILDMAAATVSAVTLVKPSKARAGAEVHKRVVNEGGPGSSVMRKIELVVGAVFPMVKGVPVQRILDLHTGVSNLRTAVKRRAVANAEQYKGAKLDPKSVAAAETRLPLLQGIDTANVIVQSGVVLYSLHKLRKARKAAKRTQSQYAKVA